MILQRRTMYHDSKPVQTRIFHHLSRHIQVALWFIHVLLTPQCKVQRWTLLTVLSLRNPQNSFKILYSLIGKPLPNKNCKPHLSFDGFSCLYIYAAHIQVKMASQLARYIEKQFILTVFFGACSTRLTDEGRHFYGRNATHSLSSMSAPLRPPMRPTYRWKLCLNCLTASENTEGFDVCSCSHI